MKEIPVEDFFGSKFHDLIEFVKYGIYTIFLYLQVDIDTMRILSILMFFDTLFGVVKAIRLNYDFSIKKLLWGFTTKFLILLIPLIVALIGKGIGYNFLWAVDFAIKMLIINEGLSCLTNILAAKTKKDIKNIDLVTLLLVYLRTYLLLLARKIFGEVVKDSIDEITKKKNKK